MDAADWDRRYRDAELIWGAPPNAVVVDLCWGLRPGRALDLACGEGRNALWLADHGWTVTAVDFSQVAIDKARTVASRKGRSVRSRITWRCADVTTAELGEGYDLALMVFLHLPAAQRRALLHRVADALAPDGALMVVGHDSTNPTEGYGGPQDPEILYSPDDLVADLAGRLEIRVAERRKRLTEGGDAIDAVLVATRASGTPAL